MEKGSDKKNILKNITFDKKLKKRLDDVGI